MRDAAIGGPCSVKSSTQSHFHCSVYLLSLCFQRSLSIWPILSSLIGTVWMAIILCVQHQLVHKTIGLSRYKPKPSCKYVESQFSHLKRKSATGWTICLGQQILRSTTTFTAYQRLCFLAHTATEWSEAILKYTSWPV